MSGGKTITMIYCVDPKLWPTGDDLVELISYRDENDFEWQMARLKDSFMVRYCGVDYFKEGKFYIELPMGRSKVVKNTNCILFKDGSFDCFVEVRNVLKIGYTDEIWETFEELFQERFLHSDEILESETC